MSKQEARSRPICASCGMTMSDRQSNGWFCPGCGEYDTHRPTIYPEDPAHPEFRKRVEDDPHILEGHAVELSSYGTREMEYVGTITEIDNEDVVHIVEEPAEPFKETERTIDLERFTMMLYRERDPSNPAPIPEEKEVFVL